ncbi:type II toxin-antitoxin system RelE/ParE family toxin [Collinsella aerofaciens]
MHSCAVVYSPLALQDLDDIWDYIAVEKDNPAAAERIVEGILARIDLLSSFPESGTPLSSIHPLRSDYRFVICDNYLTFTAITRRSISTASSTESAITCRYCLPNKMIANLGRSLSVAVNSERSKGTPLCHAKSLEIKVLIACVAMSTN